MQMKPFTVPSRMGEIELVCKEPVITVINYEPVIIGGGDVGRVASAPAGTFVARTAY